MPILLWCGAPFPSKVVLDGGALSLLLVGGGAFTSSLLLGGAAVFPPFGGAAFLHHLWVVLPFSFLRKEMK